jgi:hypothetical protein
MLNRADKNRHELRNNFNIKNKYYLPGTLSRANSKLLQYGLKALNIAVNKLRNV